MPASFDLRGASVGNLVLVGGYLNNDRDIDAVVFLFSKLVAVLGIVRPMTDVALHLEAKLEDGTRVLGQHRLTGKQVGPITSRVEELRLVRDLEDPQPASVAISGKVRSFIEQAEVICYPMGSFWSSIVANLLPGGVGSAICASESPKVYIPNAGRDPEERGMAVHDCLEVLHRCVRADGGNDVSLRDAVNFVLVDSKNADYGDRLDLDRIRKMGVDIIDTPLVTEESRPLLGSYPLAEILLSLA
jgi:CofD-related protein of GAK system